MPWRRLVGHAGADSRCSGCLPILQCQPGGGDLFLHCIRPAKGPVRLSIPVPGILEIALDGVRDAMKPGSKWRRFALDDLMGRFPLSSRQEIDRPLKRAW